MRRIGFIVGVQLKQLRLLSADRIPEGDFGLMRFGWITETVNRSSQYNLRYELYRPWRRYDALVFVKAMDNKARQLRDNAERKSIKTVFDSNVNYYDCEGEFYYDGMAPTGEQRYDAIEMTEKCDAVIADSSFLEGRCREFNSRVRWIADNVNFELVPKAKKSKVSTGTIDIIWSGQAVKLFELLSIESVLKKYKKHLRITLVTNSLGALDKWVPGLQKRFIDMLADIPHAIVPYISVGNLLKLYASQRFVCISPRFVDNSYNLGHTEWKLALAMACGNLAIGGAVPSYQDVADRSGGVGMWLCNNDVQWEEAFDRILGGYINWDEEEQGAYEVIKNHYSTDIISRRHAEYINEVLG